jgi:hypothetical protein
MIAITIIAKALLLGTIIVVGVIEVLSNKKYDEHF